MSILTGKHVVLGITGSIAAYKAAVLARLLIKEGAEVQVVITPAGKEFITPLTLSTLTRKPVVSEFFDRRDGSWNSHVELGCWADAMIIAPCTAGSIGKMAHGIADNMLITTYLSMKAPVFIAPAMDLDMYAHAATQANLALLRSYGNHIIEPETGFLASGLEGKGRMEEPEKIVETISAFFSSQTNLLKKKILITAGPTYEYIDPVRFIGNLSTGKMGFAIARECAERGAQVTLIAGPVNQAINHPNVHRIDVTSAAEMYNAATSEFTNADVAILSAAVADFTPSVIADQKIKRKGCMDLHLEPTKDIAAALGSVKRSNQRLVGFALETTNEREHAKDKLERKNFDFIVLNSLRDKGAGFGYDTNKITIIDKEGATDYPLKSKQSVAKDIVDRLVKIISILLLLIVPFKTNAVAQELNANVVLNSAKVPSVEDGLIPQLEDDIRTFLNTTQFTQLSFADNEKIDCTFNIIIKKYSSDTHKFSCQLIVQSSRPVLNSTYNSTVFNFKDDKLNFEYTLQDKIIFNENAIDNNLTAVLSFYALLIIGLDLESMSPRGGQAVLQRAENIAVSAMMLGEGWRSHDQSIDRQSLVKDYISPNMDALRRFTYLYYRKGLDQMVQNADRGRAEITTSIDALAEAFHKNTRSSIPAMFAEIKKEELINIYSVALDAEKEVVIKSLSTINPALAQDWDRISKKN